MVYMSRMASVVGVVCALFAGAASADPVVAFGLASGANPKVLGAPSTARAVFEGLLTDVGRVDFTGLSGEPSPSSKLTFEGTTNKALIGLGNYCTDNGNNRCAFSSTPTPPASPVGRYNTTGASESGVDGQWWDADGEFTLTFDRAVAAFGFYATDLGDFGGQLYITLTDDKGNTGARIKVEHDVEPNPTKTPPSTTANIGSGSLAFWGFTDTGNSYKSVKFSIDQKGTDPDLYDVFGFDDLVIGNLRSAAVPEPASLALVGLSLAALAVTRRRKPKSA